MNKDTLLEIKAFSLAFQMYEKGLHRKQLQVISDLSMSIHGGEVVAVVGSSGSGKSLLAHAILGILPENAVVSGSFYYHGEPLTAKALEKKRGREIVFVPQSVNNLDPSMKVGKQVIGIYDTPEAQKQAFARYQLAPEVAEYYPFQLSGGMARRVLISMAVLHRAELIIADEPTPGMSADMAAETLQNFRELADGGAGVLMITHDIDLALLAADKIAVFYAGAIVEVAPVSDFTGDGSLLRHPYTKALWNALPQNAFQPIAGAQPYAGSIQSGCKFRDRCPLACAACTEEIPLRACRGGEVRCCRAV